MGKASLLMVIGFSTALLMIGSNISKVSNSAMDNYLSYYRSSMAHDIAAAGTNMAARALWENMAWNAGFGRKSFMGGTFQSTVTDLGMNQVKVVTTSTYMDETSVISVILQPSSFSRFGYYSVQEGNIFWITGDTVWGPMHTQDNIHVSGDPVFMQRVTSLKSLQKNNRTDHPQFLGGFESGVNVSLPSNLSPLVNAANNGGKLFTGGDSVCIQFQSNGNVKWKTGATNGWNTDLLSSFAPNGVIYVNGANLHVSGTLAGRVTVGAGGTTNNSKQGNIYLDDDVVLNSNPQHGSSSDMLGIVAENDVIITDNVANKSGIAVQASVFSRSGSFMAENYDKRNAGGTIQLLGGIIQSARGPVGTFSGNPPKLVSGFLKNYMYDSRFLYDAPPFFPTTGNFEIVSWFE
jgi:hypothetical protein